jgi:Methyltransferase domain
VAERALSISALLRHDDWLTFPGERAAIEGVLSAVRPSVAIEIGTFRGGTLERICAHSQEVHVFDVQRFPELTPERFPDVVFHIGDSNELLPRVLDQLAESSKNVDFVFVDAEHTKEAVRLDVESLVSSGCTARTAILLHDTLVPQVRAGVEAIDFAAHPKVRFVDLDFVSGRVMSEGKSKDDLLSGLGLIVTAPVPDNDWDWPRAYQAAAVYEAFSAERIKSGQASRPLGYPRVDDLEREVAAQRLRIGELETSWSWRVTRPFRVLGRAVSRRRRQ